jgi:hypothetical protein
MAVVTTQISPNAAQPASGLAHVAGRAASAIASGLLHSGHTNTLPTRTKIAFRPRATVQRLTLSHRPFSTAPWFSTGIPPRATRARVAWRKRATLWHEHLGLLNSLMAEHVVGTTPGQMAK